MSFTTLSALYEAEHKAILLFEDIENEGIIQAGKTEDELSQEIFDLAHQKFGVSKHWHKRIVRAGVNTLMPYDENPPLVRLKEDDILFLDFGPVFEEWEADLGRTYVLGNDPHKLKIKKDVETIWNECREWYHTQKETTTGAQLYQKACEMATEYGWEFGGEIAGHIVGKFPHERLEKEDKTLYIHPENHTSMYALDKNGNLRNWILEIHLVDRPKQIGAFYEQLLNKLD